MGLPIAAIAKLASGGMDATSLTKLLKGFGIDVSWHALEGGDQVRSAFAGMAKAAIAPGAKLLSIEGETAGGEKVSALLIVRP